MAKKLFVLKNNLAEAFNETVSSALNNAGELHIEIVPLRKIELDPENPRNMSITTDDIYNGLSESDELLKSKKINLEELDSLSQSIKNQGVLNPVLLYKSGDKYKLIAGERRTLASILAGKQDIPARIMPTKPDPFKLSLIQWIENMERSDLKLWERFVNLKKIVESYSITSKKNFEEITATEIKNILGCSIQQGVNYRYLLNSSEALKEQIRSDSIRNIEKAAFISKSPLHLQESLINACKNGFSMSQLKNLAQGVSKKTNIKITNGDHIKIGFKTSPVVIQTIIKSIIENSSYSGFKHELDSLKDCNSSDLNKIFKKLIKFIETSA